MFRPGPVSILFLGHSWNSWGEPFMNHTVCECLAIARSRHGRTRCCPAMAREYIEASLWWGPLRVALGDEVANCFVNGSGEHKDSSTVLGKDSGVWGE